MPKFFALTSRGLVDALAEELTEIGFGNVLKAPGGAFFDSNWAGCYRANLRLRTSTRVILPILDFVAYKPEELYANVQKHDFTKYIKPSGTIAVDASVRECGIFRDQRFVAMKIKDAIVDQFRDKFGVRPDVDTDRPDLRIVVRAYKQQFSLSVDTTGEALFKRGYRVSSVEAPLKEHVAAALLKTTGWKADVPLVDPMCGSGTFLLEAALLATKTTPGSLRKSFAFQKFLNFDSDSFDAELNAVIGEELESVTVPIYGFDISRDSIAAARRNIDHMGWSDWITVKRQAIETLEPPCPEKGILIFNPPYGERLGERDELFELYHSLSYTLKNKFSGWTCWILSGDPELTAALKMKATRKMPVFNGNIECRFLKYEINQR